MISLFPAAPILLLRIFAISTLILISGCQSLGLGEQDASPDPALLEAIQLDSIHPAAMMRSSELSGPPGLDALIASYSALLPLLEEPESQVRVLHRLADLKMMKGEELMADRAVDELDIAIDAYTGLLQKYPQRTVNDEVLYQLAKTYDLKGMSDAYLVTMTRLVETYPQSQYLTEVQFRRGELLFSLGEYAVAQQAFEAVIAQGESSFLANAHYMQGWSLFKQNRYEAALVSYSRVLDLVLETEDDSNINHKLSRVDHKYQTMVEDLFRVMGLSFSYLGGADSLEKLFATIGAKHYEILVYDRYSELLLGKEQFSDAIEVYQRYIALHPLSLWSPVYQINTINTLEQAGFVKDIYDEKVRFVSEYGRNSAYWAEHETPGQSEGISNSDGDRLAYVKQQLEVLLIELANRHYVKAQRSKGAARKTEYQQAAGFYREFIATFPTHVLTAESVFLLGESLAQLKDWESAIAAYERAAYDFKGYEGATEAAYAAVVAYAEYAKVWNRADEAHYQFQQQAQQANRLRFATLHAHDARAIEVLYIAARFAFEQKEHEQALSLSQQLIDWPQLHSKPHIVLEARIIKAHSLYTLRRYTEAEQAYHDVLVVLPIEDQRHKALIENLAASVYQQAESKLLAGDKAGAVEEFMRVGRVAPSSALRPNADYDAASYLLELKQWSRAIEVMSAFRLRYPQHVQLDSLVPKMALAYRETEQWEKAADELTVMFKLAKTEQEKQDTLLIAAELYDRAKNYPQAILSYRQYANTYPEPLDDYMESANRLAELYQLSDKPLKRRFWLTKQMKTVDRAGNRADDRMRYLAARASAVLADDAFRQYKAIKLSLPLQESMRKKTAALEKAMQAYQKTASYGVSSYATEAGYRMAEIYAQLSKDLMDSDRPNGLNELELEQYDILLEEQAYPFEDSAIDIHEQNASRSWSGIYDDWVKNSFESLQRLLPGRYNKPEVTVEFVDEL